MFPECKLTLSSRLCLVPRVLVSNPGPKYRPVQTFLVDGCRLKLEHTISPNFICDEEKWNTCMCGDFKVTLLGRTMSFGIVTYLVVFPFPFILLSLFTYLRGGCRPAKESTVFV